jgi:hypothetical protein
LILEGCPEAMMDVAICSRLAAAIWRPEYQLSDVVWILANSPAKAPGLADINLALPYPPLIDARSKEIGALGHVECPPIVASRAYSITTTHL